MSKGLSDLTCFTIMATFRRGGEKQMILSKLSVVARIGKDDSSLEFFAGLS